MSQKNNKAALIESLNNLRVITVPYPTIKPDEVIVQIKNVGICGSDVNYLRVGQCGPYVMKKPMIIGHEASGIVVELGKDVTCLKVGDKVAVEPGKSCRKCKFCKTGMYNSCPEMVFAATPPHDGFLQNFIAHPADLCFKLPADLTLEEGALIEPLSVSIHACKKTGVTCGSNVLIIGCGSVGLLASCSAKAFGASKVVMLDKVDYKVALATKIHADYALQVGDKDSNADLAKKVQDFIGQKPDIVLDCTDSGCCLPLAVECVRDNGSVGIVGISHNPIPINLSDIVAKEINVQGLYRYSNDFEQGIMALKSKKFDVSQIISHKFSIDEASKAFDTFHIQEQRPIKIMFDL